MNNVALETATFEINYLARNGHLLPGDFSRAVNALHIYQTEGNLVALGLAQSIIKQGESRMNAAIDAARAARVAA